MTIYPAIDMLGGKCVRLKQGDYNESTVYNDSPADAAKEWASKGAEWIHLVDLDGAKAKQPINIEAIKAVRMMKGNCGVWYSDGVYYVDHSYRVNTKREAMSIGRAHNQISILCWRTMGLAYC